MTTISTTSKQTAAHAVRSSLSRSSLRRRAFSGLCGLLVAALSLAPVSAEAGGHRHHRDRHHGSHGGHHSHHARHHHGHHRGHHHYYGHHHHGDPVPWLALAAVSIAIIDAVDDDDHRDRDGCSDCDDSRDDRRDRRDRRDD